MANRILIGSTYYAEIQSKLGVGADILPNSDIDAPSVLLIAEAKIIKTVTNYASLTGDDVNYLYAATICLIAAMLAPSMSARIRKSKKDFDFSVENQAVRWDHRKHELLDEMNSLIDLISTQIDVDVAVPLFGVAGPTRANAPTYTPIITDGDVYV